MVEPFTDIDPARVRARLAEIEAEVPAGTEVLVACKYVPSDAMGALREAGVKLVGENRLGDLERKRARWGDAFTWDFIGNVQSRKLRDILPLVRLIHSVHSDSVLTQLGKHGNEETEVLIQVNVAGEEEKGGVAPEAVAATIAACPVRVVGLSTMPPFSAEPEASRPHFARLAELAAEHDLSRLSMGTSQDWRVAIEEGATTIRIGSVLFD
jgi:uncharacterized pyridoxal phosphate-containing UPF0001 family protein